MLGSYGVYSGFKTLYSQRALLSFDTALKVELLRPRLPIPRQGTQIRLFVFFPMVFSLGKSTLPFLSSRVGLWSDQSPGVHC